MGILLMGIDEAPRVTSRQDEPDLVGRRQLQILEARFEEMAKGSTLFSPTEMTVTQIAMMGEALLAQ
jgi:hypothetical protein